jgi:multiple sugar transport system permease protein
MGGTKTVFYRILKYIAAFFILLVFLFPYLIMVLTSLKSKDEIFAIPSTFFPKTPTFHNFIDIWTKIPLAHYLSNTIVIALSATIITLICAIPAAYALSRMKFKGRQVYLYLILVTQMFSPIVLLVGLYRVIGWLGLVNSIWGLVIVNAAFNQAFAVWILRGYFATIPYELEQAAWIDGCSRFQALFRVLLPLSAPGIITALIFVFIAAWNEFTFALTIISSEENKPLTVGIYAFFGKNVIQWQYLFATALVATVPVVILFLIIEKHLVSGLTAGGIKE